MILFLILFLLASPAHAQEQMYIYKALKITDGDTIKLDVSKESPLIKKLGLSVRISGIDTPEKGSKAKCKKENALGQQATKFTWYGGLLVPEVLELLPKTNISISLSKT